MIVVWMLKHAPMFRVWYQSEYIKVTLPIKHNIFMIQ